jgi:hypothetical protein
VRSRLRLLASGRQQALRAGCGWLPGLVQVWVKVLPLGLIFFVASFNLTILQVCGRAMGGR